MRQRDWIQNLPQDSSFDAITWVEQREVGTLVVVTDDGHHRRFEPVGEEWYEEIHCSLERGVATEPLLDAAVPRSQAVTAIQTARRQAVRSATQTAGVLCTAMRYLAAGEDANVSPRVLGAVATGLALEHRYEYTHQAAIDDASRGDIEVSAVRQGWQSVVRTIGTTNLLRVATTDAYHGTSILPRPVDA